MGGLLSKRADEIVFLNDVLRQYREIRKVYHYDYTAADKEVLAACAQDLRPFTYSLVPSAVAYWGSGKFVSNPKQLGLMTRASLVVLRLMASLEVFRFGYLWGSYKQGIDCTQRLVSLRTALGGEVAAIIRERDPQHPLLRFEQPPAELNEDGSRPRIVNEANRLARIVHLQQELAQAKAGQAVDRGNDRVDERLFNMVRHREEVLGELHKGGGPTAAASSGKLESMRPAQPPTYVEEYSAAAPAAAGSSARGGSSGGPPEAAGSAAGSVQSSGGLVISDQQGQKEAELAALVSAITAAGGAAAHGHAAGGGGGAGAASASSSEDPFSMVLGGGSSGGWGFDDDTSEEALRAAEEEARQQRRRERRARWWRRHGSSGQGSEGLG